MLHAALATAPDRSMVPAAAALAGLALTGALLALAVPWIGPPHRVVAALPAEPSVLPPAPVAVATARPSGDDAALTLVFHAAGASYLSLADLADPDDHRDAIETPRHAPPRVSRDAGVVAAVALVDEADVPVGYRSWRGRRVVVDDICAATVVGFAVVARRIASRRRRAHPLSAGDALRSGHAVLAARLDGCIGSYAHDAAPDAAW